MTPFEAVYGYPPPGHVPFEPGSTADPEVERQLRSRDDLWAHLKAQIAAAQNRMRQVYDRGRHDRVFRRDELVWLKRLPKGQRTLLGQPQSKLSPRYYGPFRVLERIGRAAYRLQLPPSATVHPVFHVTRLKPFIGELGNQIEIPPRAAEPQRIVRTRRVQRQDKWIDEVLVEWAGTEERYTWEDREDMHQRFPALRTLGQVRTQGGGFDTIFPTRAETEGPAPQEATTMTGEGGRALNCDDNGRGCRGLPTHWHSSEEEAAPGLGTDLAQPSSARPAG